MSYNDYNYALNKVLYYLTRRERSKKEIYNYLKKKNLLKWSSDIFTYLDDNNLIDDFRFSLHYIRDKNRFYLRGPLILVKELIYKYGVERETAEKAFHSVESEFFVENGLNLLKRKFRQFEENSENEILYKMKALLFRKGYSGDLIEEILTEFMKNCSE